MSVLDRRRLLELLAKPIDDPCSLRVAPLLEPVSQIKDDAIDIRLGTHFLIPRSEKRSSFVPCETRGEDVAHRVHMPPGRRFILAPKGVVLASAFEYLKMPGHLAAQVMTRSSIGRIFVATATATLVHPFYRGCLTLEIVNLGSASVELDVLSRIAQLQFSEVADPGTVTCDRVSGRYAAAVEPELPSFLDDETEYRKLRSMLPSAKD